MQTVLITGATGFLGLHSTRLLLEKGYAVVGTARTTAKAQHLQATLEQLGVNTDHLRLVIADLVDGPDQWAAHLQGVDYVLHIASPFPRVQPKDDTALIQTAKNGVLHVMKGAVKAGVQRLVLVSSTGAIGYGVTRQKDFTEADWTDPSNIKDTTPYFRSKTIAERAAWDFMTATDTDLELSVVNPGLILGPILDAQDYGTSAALVLKMLDGSMPALPSISYSMVDVRDVADLLYLAMTRPEAAGERFVGVSAHHTVTEMAALLQPQFPNRKLPRRKLPNFVLRLIALFDAQTAPVLLELNADRRFTGQKAQRLLHWSPRPSKASLGDTARSLIELNFVS